MSEEKEKKEDQEDSLEKETTPMQEETPQESPLEILQAQNRELEARIKELEDSNLRTHADFENTKKRLVREKDQALEYAYEGFSKEILPVIDSLEAAINSMDESCLEEDMKAKFKEGVELTLENFKRVLERYGIVAIPLQGEFNPHLHNAIMQEESEEHEDGQIIQTLQKGYQYKERILRPALVKVCKK